MTKTDNKVTVTLRQEKDRTNSLGFLSEEFVLIYKRETGGVCHDRNDTYISRYADGAISLVHFGGRILKGYGNQP